MENANGNKNRQKSRLTSHTTLHITLHYRDWNSTSDSRIQYCFMKCIAQNKNEAWKTQTEPRTDSSLDSHYIPHSTSHYITGTGTLYLTQGSNNASWNASYKQTNEAWKTRAEARTDENLISHNTPHLINTTNLQKNRFLEKNHSIRIVSKSRF